MLRVKKEKTTPNKITQPEEKMVKEIEIKYLIRTDGRNYGTKILKEFFPNMGFLEKEILCNGKRILQGYLPLKVGFELSDYLGIEVDFTPTEARLRDVVGKHYFTMKGNGGIERNELETSISGEVFDKYYGQTIGSRVEKMRLEKPYRCYEVEIDFYTDRDLIVAEIEVPTLEEVMKLNLLGKDVTEDLQYKNKNLAK